MKRLQSFFVMVGVFLLIFLIGKLFITFDIVKIILFSFLAAWLIFGFVLNTWKEVHYWIFGESFDENTD